MYTAVKKGLYEIFKLSPNPYNSEISEALLSSSHTLDPAFFCLNREEGK
jgi:hypothetical protein